MTGQGAATGALHRPLDAPVGRSEQRPYSLSRVEALLAATTPRGGYTVGNGRRRWEGRVNRFWEIWRLVGMAVSAALLGASQLQPNPLPAWVFPIVAGITLLSLVVALIIDRRHRR